MALTKQADIIGNNRTEDYIGAPVHEHEMSIGPEVTSMIIQQLTDLYTNPIEAMVRETVSNAIDATVRARNLGQDASDVEIVRPTELSPVLRIIDHGTGMNQDELEKYFSDYGNSTKLDDFTAIGSKGLGAKAMLAYTPVANIITVKDGVRVIAQMERGEYHNVLKTLSVKDTTESNGTTITITIQSKDIDSVNRAINRYATFSSDSTPLVIDGEKHSLADNYFKSSDITIGVGNDGTPIKGSLWITKKIGNSNVFHNTFSDLVYSIKSKWNDNAQATEYVKMHSNVILGGWNYKLTDSKYTDTMTFVIEIVPGLVDFPASRDEIKRNDRFDELVEHIRRGLGFGSEFTPERFLHLLDNAPESVKYQVISVMLSNHVYLRYIETMIEPWGSQFDSFFQKGDESPSFSSVVAFEVSKGFHRDNKKIRIRNYNVSCMANINRLSDGRVLCTHAMPTFYAKDFSDWLGDVKSYSTPDSVVSALNAMKPNHHDMDYKPTKEDYGKVRSVSVDYAIDTALNGDMLGVCNGKNYVTIVQGGKKGKEKRSQANKLTRLVKERMSLGECTHVFYIVDGELDSGTLADVVSAFERYSASKDDVVFRGVTTFDGISSELRAITAEKRNAKAVRQEVKCKTINIGVPSNKWLGVRDIIHAFEWNNDANGNIGEVSSDSIMGNHGIVMFYTGSSYKWKYQFIDLLLNQIPFDEWSGRPVYMIDQTDVNAKFVNELVGYPHVYIIVDSISSAFGNLKAVRENLFNTVPYDICNGRKKLMRRLSAFLREEDGKYNGGINTVLSAMVLDSLYSDANIKNPDAIALSALERLNDTTLSLMLSNTDAKDELGGDTTDGYTEPASELMGSTYNCAEGPRTIRAWIGLRLKSGAFTDPSIRRRFVMWYVLFTDLMNLRDCYECAFSKGSMAEGDYSMLRAINYAIGDSSKEAVSQSLLYKAAVMTWWECARTKADSIMNELK